MSRIYSLRILHDLSTERPAFPTLFESFHGMTMRQFYAGLAMLALLTNHPTNADWIAKEALKFADALIEAEREKRDED